MFPLFIVPLAAPAFDASMHDPSRSRCRIWTPFMVWDWLPVRSAVPLMLPLPAGPAAMTVIAEVTRNTPVRIAAPSFVFIFLTSFEC